MAAKPFGTPSGTWDKNARNDVSLEGRELAYRQPLLQEEKGGLRLIKSATYMGS